MPVYNVHGVELNEAFNVHGESLSSVYSKDGREIQLVAQPDIPVTPLTWNMTDKYKQQVTDALDYINAYKRSHAQSYSFVQFNDVHKNVGGNEPNFIDYNKGYKVLSRMLFLGDLVDRETVSEITNAVAYVEGAQASKRLVGMGNHEYWSYGQTLNPEEYYVPLTNVQSTWFKGNTCVFYNDDDVNNVRYIILDYFWKLHSPADTDHFIDEEQLNWLATAMESAGSKDIIIGAHSMFNPFTLVFTGETTNSSADTTQIKNAIVPIITAFKNRGTCTVTVNGVTHSHDFSNCTGKFILYTSGHYHNFGYADDSDFNMFTCVARSGNSWNGTGAEAGFTFYLIDRRASSIEVIICYTNNSSHPTHFTGYTF